MEAAEDRLDAKIRDANSLVKALSSLEKEAAQTVEVLGQAIRLLAQGEAAEIIQDEVKTAIDGMNKVLQDLCTKKAGEIMVEYDKLRDIMIHVRDRTGKKRPPGSTTLPDMVAGLALEAMRQDKEEGNVGK